jgi:propionyl-CoA carboxylase alpha chain
VGHLDVHQLPAKEFVWITVLNKAWIFYLLRSNVTKLITYGETREEAIQIMIKAIEEYQVEGVNIAFGKFVLNMRRFVPGNLTRIS